MKNDTWIPALENGDEFSSSLHQRTDELYRIPDAQPDEDGLIELPAFLLKDVIVFPRMVSPVYISSGQNMLSIMEAQHYVQTMIGLVQMDPDLENPQPEDFLPIGVELAVGRLLSMPDGNSSSLVQGRHRVQIVEIEQAESFYMVKARRISEDVKMSRAMQAQVRTARNLFEKCVQLDRSLPDEAHLFAININEPGWLADMIATAISPSFKERQSLLLLPDPMERIKRVNHLLAEELDVLQLEDEIQNKVQSEVDRSQREFYLREQLRAIQTELGEGDVWQDDLNELRRKVQEIEIPAEVRKQAVKEIERLSQMQAFSPEVGIIRTYLDWILDIPWETMTEDNLDVSHASHVLDQNHFGLGKAKDRILEYIAVQSLKPKKPRQPILCFVGPPGTGKTSLGKSIASALGRKFVRLSLGGLRDEAEIRGHRRTYIGARPGRIIQTIKRAGTVNPLFMLDEIDKIGNDFRGDPASALLEVLDPEQNYAFSDHYLELDYDLSKVMFVTTANVLSTIPPALIDRMEVIEFPGYIEEEKVEIARRFLIPRQMEESGLEENELVFKTAALQEIIREYTYEAGVRDLERRLGMICRKTARLKSEQKRYQHTLGISQLEKYLGPPEFFVTEKEREAEAGVATAIAWTENGGDIMLIETITSEGKGNVQITGQIGDVMQESAQAALSYIKAKAKDLGLKPGIFEHLDVHIHVPEGAIPKDGPSAGITMATALVSLFTKRKVYPEIAMTGEITLRGKILPVGGIREKVLAVHRAGMKTVIIPQKNMKDLVDVPKKVKTDLKIIPVEHIEQVLDIALEPPAPKKERIASSKKQAVEEQN